MLSLLSSLLYLSVAAEAAANVPGGETLLSLRHANDAVVPFSLPMSDSDPTARAQAIAIKRQSFLYGPSIAGNTSFYPTGPLGNTISQNDTDAFFAMQNIIVADMQSDAVTAGAAIEQAGGLQNLSSYALLYKDQWKVSAPNGPYPGMLSNYTNDLLFSMERLSINPFVVRRLNTSEALPFAVDAPIVRNLTGQTLRGLQSTGRLFYADHSSQIDLPKTPGKYGAACQAYFFIHPKTQDFLPLAIKPNNAGSNLIYTPADAPGDWLLAKIMYNINDVWQGQWYHLAATHELVEIVYEAAIRTLSDNHPILGLLKRIMLQAFAFRISAIKTLINAGGPVDQLFPWNGTVAGGYTDNLYNSGAAGAFQANYFRQNLAARGLINSNSPPLKHFPFFEDASVVHAQVKRFMTTFVNSYYTSTDLLMKDNELQAWIAEAVPARIIDFPSAPLAHPQTLIDILTHMAHLVSVVHGALNTDVPVASSTALPFHPLALYHPLPTAKGVTDIMPYMPQVQASIGQIGLLAAFNRPKFSHTNSTLAYIFADPDLQSRLNADTQAASNVFMMAMQGFSKVVSARTFDADGLSQGMPFIYTALDPEVASFYLTV